MTEKDIVDFEDKDKFIKDEENKSYIEKETGKDVREYYICSPYFL